MNIATLEMPMERVFKVQLDGTVIPGYINQHTENHGDETAGTWYWKHENIEETGFLTKETAALALVTRYLDHQQRRIHASTERVRATLDSQGLTVSRCLNCHREFPHIKGKPPTMCSCGASQFETIGTLDEPAPEYDPDDPTLGDPIIQMRGEKIPNYTGPKKRKEGK